MVVQEAKFESALVTIKEMPTIFAEKGKRLHNSDLCNVGGQFSFAVKTHDFVSGNETIFCLSAGADHSTLLS